MFRHARLSNSLFAVSLAVVAVAATVQGPLRAQVAPPRSTTGKALPPVNFDLRSSASLRAQALQRRGLPAAGAALAARQAAAREALRQLRREQPGIDATFSPMTGGVDVVRSARGPLTPPSGAAGGFEVARSFVEAHAALYGLSSQDIATLQFRGESLSRGSGLRMVRVDQTVHGLPVFQSDSRFLLDREGRLVRTVGTLVPGAASAAFPSPAIDARAALASAMQSVGIALTAADVTAVPQGPALSDKTELRVTSERIGGPATSQLVYFPLAPGVLVLAYQQTTFTDGPGDWLTVVDASDGTLLWRKNIRNNQTSTQQARFSVYVQADGKTPADSPAPHSPTTAAPGAGTQFPEISRSIVSMLTVQDPVASPAGWIPDGGDTTTGNNVDACVDRVIGTGETNVCDLGTLDFNGRPIGNVDAFVRTRDFLGAAPRDFSYSPAPVGGDPNAGDTPTGTAAAQVNFRRGAVTQLFYVTNWYHDQLFQLGFDEAAGNFQNTNFSGMGLGGDRVLADAQDGSGTNNANFSTPPDGQSGRMQMYRFTGPTPDRDGDLDTEIVIHELTHGLSNRLVGNAAGLVWSVGGGMGEGWSDFYALSLLNNTNADDPNGSYASGSYATYQLGGLQDNYVYGIRRFPYSTNNAVNPLTWADVDDVTANYAGGIPINPLGFEFGGAFEVHNIGEIWALTLWEIRARVIADPAGANGDVPTGNQTMLQLVTDALKMTPSNPSFLDARQALIDADCATNACANERWIWEGFADRGLGYDAEAPLGQTGFINIGHMSLKESTTLPRLSIAGFTVDDTISNNSGGADPTEPIRLSLSLQNGWRGSAFSVAGATAVLTSSTPGVVIPDSTASWPAIAGGATVAPSDTFVVVMPPATCGSVVDLTLQVTSTLGVSTQNFSLRLGLPSGTGAPITYTFPVNLGIPDNAPTGVTTTGVITAADDIADLDLRIDSLTHTFSGDVTVMLRSPGGYGTDFIWMPGIIIGAGTGDNFVNTVIDDAATGDLLVAPNTAAPYTGSWRPAFNSPSWAAIGDPAVFPDPVGQLAGYNGTSSAGTWTLHVADNFAADTGTLTSWSMIVTPRSYTCAPYVDPPPVTTITATPAAPNGLAGWYVTPPSLFVSATDNIGGGVAETRCVLDPGVAPANFAAIPAGCGFAPAAFVTANGQHTLYAASVDTAANAGAVVSATIRLDNVAPSLTCALPAPTFTVGQAGGQVLANVTDATSGVASATASAAPDTSSPGSRNALISATDLAGNLGSVVCAYTVSSPPTITIGSPTTDPTFAATSPFVALTGAAGDDGSVAQVTWANNRGGSGTALGTATWSAPVIPLQSGVNVITVTATDDDGETATDTLTVNLDALTYVLAEGSTGFFDTVVALANPNSVQARTTVTFVKPDGSTIVQSHTLPPTSQTSITVGDIAGLESMPVSTIVASLDMLPLGVERTMMWDTSGYGGSSGEAIGQARTRWLFAEGAQGFFNTYVLVINPTNAATTATVTFLPEAGGAPVVRTYPMPALSRLVVDADSVQEIRNRSFGIVVEATQPIVAERAMYFGTSPTAFFIGGHASVGATDPSAYWYFAEGATGAFFDTFLLFGNPGNTAAQLTLTYLLDNGQTVTRDKTVPPNARLTVPVEGDAPELASANFATQVTSSVPIVAERAMYWVGAPGPWTESHDSLGVVAPGAKWVVAGGRVGQSLDYQTYILLANPSTTAAQVTITYLRGDGTTVTSQHTVPATSRVNVHVNGAVPTLQNESFGARIESTNAVEIMVEKSVYWNVGGVTWAGGTNVTATRLP
jgi:subtilisin-like proprotein convertase family protein